MPEDQQSQNQDQSQTTDDQQQDTSTNDQTGDSGDTSTGDQDGQSNGNDKGGAPESYAEFKIPEGADDTIKERIKEALPMFKEANLSQEQAQKLIDYQSKALVDATTAFNTDKENRLNAIKNDKEFGGDKFTESQEKVGKALEKYLNEQERNDLADFINRFGTHPALYKLMYRVSQRMGEDTRMEQSGNTDNQSDAAILANMYPSMHK